MMRAMLAPVSAAAAAAVSHKAQAESGFSLLNMTQGVTEMSRHIYELHMIIFWVCVVIAFFVFGAMIYSIIKFRKSSGAVPDVTLVHNTKVEFVWTVVPVFILIAMAVPAAHTLVEIEDTTKTELSIKVTGFQWGWQYDFLVDHPLVVPVDTKVRLLITGADVIHSWWVPAFGVKKDAIPGFVNEAWFKIDKDKPGRYRGQCAELCGRDHGFMPIVVDARSKEDFAAWLKAAAAQQKAAQPAAATAPPAATPASGRVSPSVSPSAS
jgi:cytochrome c oxidase subunit 2